jgi:hypothetical protein
VFGLLMVFITEHTVGQFQIGGKCGPAYFVVVSENVGIDYTKYRAKPGSFALSVDCGRQIIKSVRLMVALEYVFQSYRFDAETSGHWYHDSLSYDVTAGTLDLQIMPQFIFGNKIRYYVFPGLYFGRMIHSHYKGIIDNLWDPDPPKKVEGWENGQYLAWGFGVITGAGMEIPLQKNLVMALENLNTFGLNGSSFGSGSGHFFNFRLEAGIRYTFNGKE